MKLSVIIPVYNEVRTIREILKKVNDVKLEKELVVVDDGSSDGTRDVLKEMTLDNLSDNLKIVFHSKNKGKGSAIRTGLKYVTGDVIVIQDADMEYDPEDFVSMMEKMEEENASVVYGSRFLSSSRKSYWRYYLGGRFLSFLANLLYGAKITDEPTCYKMFKKEVSNKIRLRCRKFEFCPEITAKIKINGYKIHEIPIYYNPRKLEEGKKISWKDGIDAILTLLKYRL